ncbi:MAG: 23S rRNA (guanosine(2251)-2'-O)-methyltransferase RlmB [Eubacteriaceae bacterium]|nr:23S rRNA (guanosine(2251)-2'-O)-methyltransferase RlmB [Eubacteriaceae bacterium]
MAEFEIIYGRNPVREALKAGTVNRLILAQGNKEHGLLAISAIAREKGVAVANADRRKLDSLASGGVHQGVVAYISPVQFCSLQDIIHTARDMGQKPFVVFLDSIMDPHNYGAIIRSAYCAGAHGIVVAKHRAAPLGETAFKASAGAAAYLPIAEVPNIAQAITTLKKQGVFVVCADTEGQAYYSIDYDMPLAIVVGNEGKGVGKLIGELCDFRANIPLHGNIGSLNASVAAGVIFFEASKQRLVALNNAQNSLFNA